MEHVVYIEVPRVSCFTGCDGPHHALEFEEQVRRAWTVIGTNPTLRRQLILSNVGPVVRDELRCQDPDAQKTPEELLELILEVFGETRSPIQLLQVLLEQRQSKGEFRAFSIRLRQHYDALIRRQRQLKQAPLEEFWVRDMLVQGSSDVDLRRHLQERIRVSPDMSFYAVRQVALDYLNVMEELTCTRSSIFKNAVSSPILACDSVPQPHPHRVDVHCQRADHTRQLPALMSLSPQLITHKLMDGQLPRWLLHGRRIGSGRFDYRRSTPRHEKAADTSRTSILLAQIKTLSEEMTRDLQARQISLVPSPVVAEERDSEYLDFDHLIIVNQTSPTEPQPVLPTPTSPPRAIVQVPSPDRVPALRRSNRQVQKIQKLMSEGSVATMTIAPPL